ncbi:hypothetical protein PAMA_002018 [Pampus argenteus]
MAVGIAAFNIDEFVANPSLVQLDKCKKSELREIAEYFGVAASGTLVKAELKAVVLDRLLAEGVLGLPALAESPVMTGRDGPLVGVAERAAETPLAGVTPDAQSGRVETGSWRCQRITIPLVSSRLGEDALSSSGPRLSMLFFLGPLMLSVSLLLGTTLTASINPECAGVAFQSYLAGVCSVWPTAQVFVVDFFPHLNIQEYFRQEFQRVAARLAVSSKPRSVAKPRNADGVKRVESRPYPTIESMMAEQRRYYSASDEVQDMLWEHYPPGYFLKSRCPRFNKPKNQGMTAASFSSKNCFTTHNHTSGATDQVEEMDWQPYSS